jgi:hypothetical protein
LLFHSDRKQGHGGTDLWIAHRDARDKPFNLAENLGPRINTLDHEGGAALSSDGLTLLFHRFAADTAELTHWQTTRRSTRDPFNEPQPLFVPGLIEHRGFSLNLSASADTLYCATTRGGSSVNIAVSRRVRKP